MPSSAIPQPSRATVVVCTHDRAALLEDCLLSVAAALPPDGELVVCATDARSKQLVDGLVVPARHLVSRPGKSRQLNAALRASTAPIVVITDDDCRVDATWVEAMAAPFADPEVGAVFGPVQGLSSVDGTKQDPVPPGPAPERSWLYANGAAMAVRRRAAFEVGGFDERLGPGAPAHGEEHDLVLRMQERGWQIVVSDAPPVEHLEWRDPAETRRNLLVYSRGAGAFLGAAVRRRPTRWGRSVVRRARYQMALWRLGGWRFGGRTSIAFLLGLIHGFLLSPRRFLEAEGEPADRARLRVLAMSDFGSEGCGVGGSEAVIAERSGGVTVLDTADLGLFEFIRRARHAASADGSVCVGVYPTTATIYRAGLLPRALVLRALFGKERFRLHMHELQHLRRLLRWPAELAMLLPGRVIVSSESEAAAARRSVKGWVGRRAAVRVAAPTNGTAPAAAEIDVATEPHPDRSRTVGVFGLYRPDKGAEWLTELLDRLDPRFTRLVVAGGGWEEHDWHGSIASRYEIELLGHVPRSDLAGLFASWGVAVAPLWGPAHDGRMSLRTPLAFGVPTLTVGPAGPDLRLRPAHLLLVPPTDPGSIDIDSFDRWAGAEEVAAFERTASEALAAALFD